MTARQIPPNSACLVSLTCVDARLGGGHLYPKFIVLGTLVEAGRQCPSPGQDDSYFIVFTSELTDRNQVVECHNCDKLNLVAEIAPQQLDAGVPKDPPITNPNESVTYIKVGQLQASG